MLYALFIIVAVAYNIRKFIKEREAFLSSLTEAKSVAHREMILGHHFYVFIFEVFLAIIVAKLISSKDFTDGILGLGLIYICLIFSGYLIYKIFIKYIEEKTNLTLKDSFEKHLIKELRVSFALIMLPILMYSLINMTFQESNYEALGNFWFIGLPINIIFVSVLSIICTVIIMLKLIPNREITEPEYLEVIHKRLEQIGMRGMRVRWIETDMKNAFVVGIKILRFSNQTMFLGKSLRTTLSLEEFDAVVAHELSHVALRHIHRRMIHVVKNIFSLMLGLSLLLIGSFLIGGLFWGDEVIIHSDVITKALVLSLMVWTFINYSSMFKAFRAQEFEADAYAVLKLGASLNAMSSALVKLTTPDELPEYLKSKMGRTKEKGIFTAWFMKIFSSHPQLEERISMLHYKINNQLPYDYQPLKGSIFSSFRRSLFQWKVTVPLTAALFICLTTSVFNYREGLKEISIIKNSSSETVMTNPYLVSRINSKPALFGKTLMFYVVKKADPVLIDYFLERGADKGKTLIYISETKNYELFKKYFALHHKHLSEDEYFLILHKTAQSNFVEGYRLLVNNEKFEALKPKYKSNLTDIMRNAEIERRPASEK